MADWIDTHCHLDAAEFDPDRDAVAQAAEAAGVRLILPAVAPSNFGTVRDLAHRLPGAAYALGIHPLATPEAHDQDLDRLSDALAASIDDPRLVAVGEIGLDFFVPAMKTDAARARQEWFYREQLKLARRHSLPVLLHVRRSADALLKGLRQVEVRGGIGHAFNGSAQQAEQFVARGFCLGFGGTLTFERSLQIRRLAATLPAATLVLETDAPDIAPSWLYRKRNTPAELPRIGGVLAALRGWSTDETAAITRANALRVLPRLAAA